jgi:putative ABC transport system permease protein
VEAGLAADVEYHLDKLTEEFVAKGLPPAEARRAAIQAFGPAARIRDDCREQRPTRHIENFLLDARHGLRLARRTPSHAAAVAATLALGIGANTVLFSLADALLRKSAPFFEPERLVVLYEARVEDPNGRVPLSPGNYADWRTRAQGFSSMGAYVNSSVNLTAAPGYGGDAERLAAVLVDAGFFRTLGAAPLLGRALGESDMTPGQDRSVVISHALWRKRFGGDTAVLGRPIELSGGKYFVTGVMPPGFAFPSVDLWLPLSWDSARWSVRPRPMVFAFGRLAPGVSREQAMAGLNTLAVTLEREHPESNEGWRATTIPMREFLFDTGLERYLWLLGGAVLLVLLIACANSANLQLARVSGRFRELALRQSLGASRTRIALQLVTESLLMALAGAALAVAVAFAALNGLRAWMPEDVARSLAGWSEIAFDLRSLAFASAAALVTGLLASVAPVWWVARSNSAAHLGGAGKASRDRGRKRLRQALVAAEIALAIPLLYGALQMVRGFRDMWNRDQGYQADSVLTLRVELPAAKYSRPSEILTFQDNLLDRLRALPGASAAFAATSMPHSGVAPAIRYFSREGDPSRKPGDRPLVVLQAVSPEYLPAMRVPLLSGRHLSSADTAESKQVVVISQRLAKQYWPGEDPLGKRMKWGDAADATEPWVEIVGVAGDVLQFTTDAESRSTVYAPIVQAPLRSLRIGLRTRQEPMLLAAAAQRELRGLDPELPAFQVKTLNTLREEAMVAVRGVSWVMTALGLLAAVLAVIGLYALIAYAVSERKREFGIRMALGAKAGDIYRAVFRQGAVPCAMGLAAGIALTASASRLWASQVAGMAKPSVEVFSLVVLLFAAVAAAAHVVPARRAGSVEAVAALREE